MGNGDAPVLRSPASDVATPAPEVGVEERVDSRATAAAATGRRRVAIVGVPNSGKSLLFQRIARKYTDSSNYPYTTREVEEARVLLGGVETLLLDTPGITGLELCSEDEAATRELLERTPPDVILVCMDAGNLSRSLILTAQLADLQLPMVVGLNMVDEAQGRGLLIDPLAVARELEVPVVVCCAADGRGVGKLVAAVAEARPAKLVPYPAEVESRLPRTTSLPRAAGLKEAIALQRSATRPVQLGHLVLETHQQWAAAIAARVSHRTGLEPRRTFWDHLGAAALHPLGAWLMLAAALGGVYLAVSEVGVKLLANGLDAALIVPLRATIARLTGPGALQEILVGPYGLLSLGVFNALGTVLPILGVFYLVFGLLEDIGYFPLLAVQFDRLLRFAGLTGKAVLPMTLGFGCNAMATLAARGLDSKRQRFIACFLIALGVPCAIQLGVFLAILSSVSQLILVGLLASVLALELGLGTLLHRLLPRSERGEFLVELPRLRPPRWRNIVSKTGHRLAEFLVEAGPLFVAAAAVMLVLQFTGALHWIRTIMAPVVTRGLGMPGEYGDILLATLARREVGAVMFKQLVDHGLLAPRQVFTGLLVMILFVPCVANTMVLGRVVGWGRTVLIFAGVAALALTAGLAVNALWP